MDSRFTIKFRGVRGSYPVPGETTIGVGGNTSCVEVNAGDHLIILDAGTGIISLGKELVAWHEKTGKPVVATMLFSHTHHDHTQGFPYFEPAYWGTSKLYMFGPRTFYEDIEEALSRAMLSPTFPVALEDLKSLKIISNLEESEVVTLDDHGELQIWNVFGDGPDIPPDTVQIRVLKSFAHPKGGVSIYKITWLGKEVVYATDTESYVGGDTRLINFARGVDLLIHDAQYVTDEYMASQGTKQGWGHSTPEMATTVAAKAGAKRLVLFHHDPLHDDAFLAEIERRAQELFPNTQLAREGMVIEL